MTENQELKGDGEVDLMDELLDDVGDNFDELNDITDDKTNKRKRRSKELKDSSKKVEENKEKKNESKRKEKNSINNFTKNKKDNEKKKSRNVNKGKEAIEQTSSPEKRTSSLLENLSDSLSSDDELSMSEDDEDAISRNSSISRESSIDREDFEGKGQKRKRSNSESSLKSQEGQVAKPSGAQHNNSSVKRSPSKGGDASARASSVSPPERAADGHAKVRVKRKYDLTTKVNYLMRECRFFVIKSNNEENVAISKASGVWSTPPQNEAKLNMAVKEARNVILLFSVKESGRFCGFCRLSGESRRDLPPVEWVRPPGVGGRGGNLGGTFNVDWINKNALPFPRTQHLYNPWNEGKPVKIGRDGQEIFPHVGEELCRLFPADETVNLTPILHKSKKEARSRRHTTGPLRRPISVPGMAPSYRGRGGFRPYFNRGRMDHMHAWGGGGGRRRMYDDYSGGPRVKRMRGAAGGHSRGRGEKAVSSYDSSFERQRGRSPPPLSSSSFVSGGGSSRPSRRDHVSSAAAYDIMSDDGHKLSYDSFMREMRHFQARPQAAIPPMAFPPPPPFDPLSPPRYYDGPPMPEFSSSASRHADKRTTHSSDPYDRSVAEFLMRTRDHDRSRDDRDLERDSRAVRRYGRDGGRERR